MNKKTLEGTLLPTSLISCHKKYKYGSRANV